MTALGAYALLLLRELHEFSDIVYLDEVGGMFCLSLGCGCKQHCVLVTNEFHGTQLPGNH